MSSSLKSAFKSIILLSIAAIVLQGMAVEYLHAKPKTLTIEQKFNGIKERQRELYNIVHTEWRGTHGFIIGCHSCEGAMYDTTTGALTNPTSLVQIPTSWNIRIPNAWNGKVVVVVPPGNLDQAVAFNVLSFLGTYLNNQYAIAIMNHPAPGFPGFAYDDFSDAPYTPREFRREYLRTSRIIKHLVRDIFGHPQAIYGVATSRGTSLGLGMLLDAPNSVFDGFLVTTGGDGWEGSLEGFQEAFGSAPNRLPFTGIPPVQTTATQKSERLLFFIGTVDPAYENYIRSGASPDEQLARGLAYDISKRPKKIQRDWDFLAMGADLQRPTIIYQGLRDRTVPIHSPLRFMQRVEDAYREGLLRAYFIKDASHVAANDPPGLPNSFYIDGLAKLDAWVQHGTEPSPLNTSPYTPSEQASCAEMGLASMDCFCEVLEEGVGGFCSDDDTVACVTANPAKPFFSPVPPLFTPIPDDTCVGLGKGVCVPEVPPECGQ